MTNWTKQGKQKAKELVKIWGKSDSVKSDSFVWGDCSVEFEALDIGLKPTWVTYTLKQVSDTELKTYVKDSHRNSFEVEA
jgi:hypothetical protein